MIEAYAFLAAFAVQVLVMSVLLPAWFIRYFRVQATSISAERLAQRYPGADVGHARERFLTQYRALTIGIAVLALLLLGWIFSDVRRADWSGDKAEALVIVYFLAAQMLPLFLFGWFVARFNKEHKPAEGKRTAILQRRGLFDFVSPFIVFVAVLSYFLYAAFVIYIEQHPFPGFAGPLINIGVITLVYAANAFAVYVTLYRKKEESARDARGSPGHDRSVSEGHRLFVRRHRLVHVAQPLASAAGTKELGTVRAQYVFRHLRASRFHGLRCAAAQARSG